MPAVTLRKSMAQSAQSCGVRRARDGGQPPAPAGPAAAPAAVEAGGSRSSAAASSPTAPKTSPDAAKRVPMAEASTIGPSARIARL